MTYLFFLGQTSDLCWEELKTVLARFALPEPDRLEERFAALDSEELIDVEQLQHVLGGTYKIAQIHSITPHLEFSEVESTVKNIITELQPKRFALAEHGRDHLPVVEAREIKRQLNNAGTKVSYHETPRTGANAAVLKHNKSLTELHVIQLEQSLLFATTLTWQDPDAWRIRDVEKPMRDRKRGMLSSKVSRMMLNLGIGTHQPQDAIVLDPFCGMGTILIEAVDLGVLSVLGNDASPEAIVSTTKNLAWWSEESSNEFQHSLTVKKSENLEPRDFPTQPTCIVTEPFLGKLTPTPEQIPGVIRGLEKMYKGTVRSFAKLLPEGGRVVMILPAYEGKKGKTITVTKALDEFAAQGFEQLSGPFRGGRPSAVTQREIYVFEKKAPRG
ncbi:hypothetical protein LRY65_05905 [Candidatus Woesebacteria bacterium]|nr:hypothetical protein [Candidatus Woesebacteria bacterium]MCD8506786.1 hypothetical protein [Candidatus Woesebacteria bacterium]MCD8527694.1 hypothetical protein [Candidatus Woesebacteria bacterium]MCD8546336.1 hypothetical protein [Candidatus Woesebacteria bacterium]